LVHGRNSLDNYSHEGGITRIILSDVDDIAEYLDKSCPNSKLMVQNAAATKVCLNVFSRFSYFMRDIASKPTQLEAELEKLDNYLKSSGHIKFLNGNNLTHVDCSLLPKLQHIRVAGEYIKKFRIPYRFRNLWKYLKNAYDTDAFQKSCPPDREIIWHWSKTHLSNKDLLLIMQETAKKTLTIPDDLKL
jgi:chloride intracellular channel protein 2